MTENKWELKSQRGVYGKTLIELGKKRNDVVVATADLACSVMTKDFSKVFPERHFNFGIAEQNMISACAGLAASGKLPFVSTFAIFLTGRVYDQIRQSIAYPKMNVKIVATHAGITVGEDGATHQMIEDIALMSVLPHMTVIVPADAPETEKTIWAISEYDGPVYVRLGRAEIPVCTGMDECLDFEIGKATVMRDGSDVTLIGTGIMVSKCLEAADELRKQDVDARVINLSTIKPLDEGSIIKAARETGCIVTAEEHNIMNGMGSAVASTLVENVPVPMNRVGIRDRFGESGPASELMEKFGLTVNNIVKSANDVLKRRGGN